MASRNNIDDDNSVAKDLSSHSLGSQGAGATSEAASKKGSRVLSHATGASSTNAEFRFAREISETFSMKLRDMKWCFLAVLTNVLLLVAIRSMGTEEGIAVVANKQTIEVLEGIILVILLLATNIFTLKAMDTGLSAFFGFQMATKGRSMSVIGFSQTPGVFKMSYANDLSLNSTVRKILNRLAYIWAILELVKILSPIGASGIFSTALRVDDDTPIDCVLYQQIGVPVDRKFPNIEVEIGFAELIFGKSIGRLRSEEAVDVTTAIVGPQLIGVVVDGDTIVGDGYEIKLYTHCLCSYNESASSLVDIGLPASVADQFSTAAVNADRRNYYMTTHLEMNDTAIIVYNSMLNTPLCGGLNTLNVPICKTEFYDHKQATILVEYMTDGTTASIAQKTAYTRDLVGDADLTWAFAALQNMFGAGVNTHVIPSQVPGMMTPLFWWTTPDLMAMDPALLEAGLETLFTIIFRAGVQRTYSTDGASCIRNVVDTERTVLKMHSDGLGVSSAALIIQVCFVYRRTHRLILIVGLVGCRHGCLHPLVVLEYACWSCHSCHEREHLLHCFVG